MSLFFLPAIFAQKASLDVLFVYTSSVKSLYGNHDGVLAKAQEIIAKGNLGFDNSLINAEFNLAHLEEIGYTESNSFSTDLNFIADDEAIAILRSEWGADLVCLLRDGSEGGTAGLGRVLKTEGGRERDGFSVSSIQSSVSSNTFTHEIGHNLGAVHDKFNSTPDGGLYLYSHGHHFSASGSFRTIMAYQQNFNTQINYFSNPDVSFQGTPTGVAEGNPDPADNARTLNITAPWTEKYEKSKTLLPSFVNPFPNFTFTQGQPRTLQALATATPPLSYQWYAGNSGDISAPIGGATSSEYTTPNLTQPETYWVRVTNPNGSSDSPNFALTSVPSGLNTDQINNPSGGTFLSFSVQNGVVWQEFVPSVGYLHALELRLWKDGSPGRLRAKLSDENGNIVFSKIYENSEVPDGIAWFSIPLQMYVTANTTYRISLQRLDDGEQGDVFRWQTTLGNSDEYPAGAARPVNSPSFGDTNDYFFRTTGSNESLPTTTINPTDNTISGSATNYDITVTTSGSWSATESLDWISVSPTSGTGNGTVTVTVNANNTDSERMGIILIGGNNHTITQSANSVSTSIDLSEKSVPANASDYDVIVTSNGAWSTSENLDWVSLTPTSGNGNDTVTVSITTNNTGSERIGAIQIGGNAHTITQSAINFSGSITPSTSSFEDAGGSSALSLTTVQSWSASSNDAWISLTGTSSGTGNASIAYSVAANTTPSLRTGTITIESLTHTVRQNGSVSGQNLTFNDWMMAFYTNSEIAAMTPNAMEADSDGDGLNNKGEFLLNLDPTSNLSHPEIVLTKLPDSMTLEITPYIAGPIYSLNSSDDLSVWSPVQNLTPTNDGSTLTFTLPLNNQLFYQLGVEEPTP